MVFDSTSLGKQMTQSIPSNTSCLWAFNNTLSSDTVLTISSTSFGGYTYLKYFKGDDYKKVVAGDMEIAANTNDTYVAPGSSITVPAGGGFAIIFIVPIGKTPASVQYQTLF